MVRPAKARSRSGVWKLIVWTRVSVQDEAALADLVIDPHEVSRLMPRWVRWDVSDPVGLVRARRDGVARRFATRVRSPLGSIDWPVDVLEGSEPRRFTESSHNAWFDTWLHRHRIERAIGERLRYVDELVLQPSRRPGSAVVKLVERVVTSSHHRLMGRLRDDGVLREEPVTSSRLYRLEVGNLEHVEAALGELPGAGGLVSSDVEG